MIRDDGAQPPTRPEFDLRLVPAALAAWAATAAGITWCIGPAIATAMLVLSAVWALAWWRLGDRCRVLGAAGVGVIGAAVVAAGFALAAGLRADAVRHHPLTAEFGATIGVTVAPDESPRSAGNGRLMFRASLIRVGDDESDGSVTVFAAGHRFADLCPGQPARFRARVSAPRRHDLSVAVLTAVGDPVPGHPGALQRAAQSLRAGFAETAREVLPADQAAMLPGLVLGDTSAVGPATTAEFRIAGLTHLTAVSGANVTIVCGVVLFSARLVGPRVAVLLAAVALAVFVLVVQPSASVLRAAVMGAIALVAVLSARRRQAIPILAATVLAVLLCAPRLAVDAGFALSVSATAALVVLAPVWSARLTARGWPKPLADAVSIALAAHLVTAPLIAAISGKLSMISVLANLTVAIAIPPITVLGTAAAAVGGLWPGAAGVLVRFTGPELWWLLRVAHAAAAVPGAAISVPSGWPGLLGVGCSMVAGVLLWPRRWFRRTAAGILLGALAWSVSGAVGGP